ncbi:hypothetical protein Tco_0609210 [Tanacetum coccineum]
MKNAKKNMRKINFKKAVAQKFKEYDQKLETLTSINVSEIDKNEDHILRPSTVAIAKKLKELIQKDELTITDLEGAGLEKLKQ